MAFREAVQTGAEDEEALLIYRAQQADPAAWDEIFERYYDPVFSFVFCRTAERTSAEDVTAEVFVEAWKGIRRFRYRGTPLLPWLYRIAHNLLADYHRSRRRSPTQPLAEETHRHNGASDEAEHVVLWQSISEAMKRLTPDQQQVLVCRFVQGLSLAETGEALGKRENAIKALEFRALRAVRRILGETAGLEEEGKR
jgi:RNA polymerase sigma-70 factor (ECF subfamily)